MENIPEEILVKVMQDTIRFTQDDAPVKTNVKIRQIIIFAAVDQRFRRLAKTRQLWRMIQWLPTGRYLSHLLFSSYALAEIPVFSLNLDISADGLLFGANGSQALKRCANLWNSISILSVHYHPLISANALMNAINAISQFRSVENLMLSGLPQSLCPNSLRSLATMPALRFLSVVWEWNQPIMTTQATAAPPSASGNEQNNMTQTHVSCQNHEVELRSQIIVCNPFSKLEQLYMGNPPLHHMRSSMELLALCSNLSLLHVSFPTIARVIDETLHRLASATPKSFPRIKHGFQTRQRIICCVKSILPLCTRSDHPFRSEVRFLQSDLARESAMFTLGNIPHRDGLRIYRFGRLDESI